MRTLFLTLITCLFVLPAYAKYSGGTGEPNDPYQIATAADLIALGETPEDYDKHFLLTADIDLAPNLPGRKVFNKAVIAPTPAWNGGTPFTGVFDGNSHRISHLTINGGHYVGLFGQLESGAEVRNLGIVDVNITGSENSVGGLVGSSCGSMIRCYSTGLVSGDWWVGGLVGSNYGTVTQCYSTCAVGTTGWYGGGLVGSNGRTLMQCYSTGAVSGKNCVGGLVGQNGDEWGGNFGGKVIHCYSTGSIRGEWSVGGLVGSNGDTVTQCYSIGAVSGRSSVGGLVGRNGSAVYQNYWGTVAQCYSSGLVKATEYGASEIGGLVGSGSSKNVTDCFWDTQTSGQATSAAGTGKTTAEMQTAKTFLDAGWDFVSAEDGPSDIWAMPKDGGYPILW